MSITVVELDPADEWTIRRMLDLRERVYGDDDAWCRPFDGTLQQKLKHPRFASRQRVFMVRRTGEDVGCAVLRHSDQLELQGRPVATIGDFEALHDPEATCALVDRMAQAGVDDGAEEIIGPMNGDSWHGFRFNLGPWDESPFLREPYNPSYYPELWKQAGFKPLQTYRSLRIDDLKGAARYHQPRWAEARTLGYRVEPMSGLNVDEALDRVYDMIRVIDADNRFYTSIRRPTFKKLYDGIDDIVADAFSLFLVDRNGDDAAFALVFPDYARAVTAMDGRRDLWGKLQFLARRRTDTVNIKTFGVMPDHRGLGLASAMAHHYFAAIADAGYSQANICLIHDDNTGSQRMEAHRGRILRRYGLYRYGRRESPDG